MISLRTDDLVGITAHLLDQARNKGMMGVGGHIGIAALIVSQPRVMDVIALPGVHHRWNQIIILHLKRVETPVGRFFRAFTFPDLNLILLWDNHPLNHVTNDFIRQ